MEAITNDIFEKYINRLNQSLRFFDRSDEFGQLFILMVDDLKDICLLVAAMCLLLF